MLPGGWGPGVEGEFKNALNESRAPSRFTEDSGNREEGDAHSEE